MEKAIAYYRVSTQRQGVSGLGLDAQRVSVEALCRSRGWKIVAERTDIESGRHNERPGLIAALEDCKTSGAVLVIAKIDRLARKASFVLTLRDAGTRFVAADLPDMNELTVGILAVIAESEAKAISERTKAALAAAKARGTKIGNPQNMTPMMRAKGSAAWHAKAVRTAAGSIRHAANYYMAGWSLSKIAAELNKSGLRAPAGGLWTPTQVRRLVRLALTEGLLSCPWPRTA